MKIVKNLCIGLCLLYGVQGILGQEMTAKKYENPQWYNIVHIDYLPGKFNEARTIIADYFIKANEKSGTNGPTMVLELNSGPYDIMAVWHMEEGIESMNWEMSPDNVKWRKALNEIAGTAEKAGEIMRQYQSCIASTSNQIARLR
ncbi:MAG TPA: hypothetical protein VKN36_11390 [Eudoraea sp.]|nr:hypothetical protein [Eudoraea sp.]